MVVAVLVLYNWNFDVTLNCTRFLCDRIDTLDNDIASIKNSDFVSLSNDIAQIHLQISDLESTINSIAAQTWYFW